MQLRDYQERNVERLREAMRTSRRVLYVAPTGSGKTVLFAFIAEGAAAKGKRVLVLLHRIELVRQTVEKLAAFDVAAGLVTAQRTERLDAGVVVAAVQTLARREADPGPIDLVVVDEAHHAVASTWERVLGRFADAHVLGVTATPERLDGRGLADVFEVMVEGPDVAWLAERGYLAKARAFGRLAAVEDLKAIRTRRGDYDREELTRLMLELPLTEAAVQDYQAMGEGRPAFAFCVGRHHAEVVALAFADAGVPAANLDGGASVRRCSRRSRPARSSCWLRATCSPRGSTRPRPASRSCCGRRRAWPCTGRSSAGCCGPRPMAARRCCWTTPATC
jgi:superfamily II DNA or RNA helicase